MIFKKGVKWVKWPFSGFWVWYGAQKRLNLRNVVTWTSEHKYLCKRPVCYEECLIDPILPRKASLGISWCDFLISGLKPQIDQKCTFNTILRSKLPSGRDEESSNWISCPHPFRTLKRPQIPKECIFKHALTCFLHFWALILTQIRQSCTFCAIFS